MPLLLELFINPFACATVVLEFKIILVYGTDESI